ncbi:hypothetical protein [Epilithonimonas hominis]|uniref:Uncharacterized protein n=1 Tax=Epilithonimonas hominis TaxID=420404 RepID=A0A1H6JH07_9FLAO|nr:hypothetical protein [Epilithonimonas hominis]SEH61590.1 hypothetical protein SAMN05421793_11539 [Epilithonimonas hominis]
MAKKFITYGSNAFVHSAKRIIEEAKSLNIFDETQRYDFKDLPLSIQSSPLFLDKKKGGFWLWKAYVIYDSLSKLNDGDLLVYSDSGCELKNPDGWKAELEILNLKDAIFYQYSENRNYAFSKFNPAFNDSPKLKYWMKKNLRETFQPIFDNEAWLEKNKLMAGFIIVKKTPDTMMLIKQWLDVMILRPDLVADPLLFEKQSSEFSSHRHDQSILSIIVRYYEDKINILVKDELSESDYPDQILKASRRLDHVPENKLKSQLKKLYYRIKK